MEITLNVKHTEVIADLWELMNDIYNHPDTPQTVKDMMDLKSRRIMDKNFAIYKEMKVPKNRHSK